MGPLRTPVERLATVRERDNVTAMLTRWPNRLYTQSCSIIYSSDSEVTPLTTPSATTPCRLVKVTSYSTALLLSQHLSP